MKNKITKNIISVAFVALLMIIILLLFFKNDIGKIMNHLANFNFFWLIIAIILIVGYWFFKGLGMHELIKLVNPKFKISKSFQIILITEFFNGITPFASGGQPGQIYLVSRENIKVSTAANIVIQNFILYQIALIVYGIIAIIYNYYFHIFEQVPLLKTLILVGFICNFAILVILFILSFGKKFNQKIIISIINFLYKIKLIKNKEAKIEKFNNTTENFYKSATLLNENKISAIKSVIYNFIALTCIYVIPIIIFYGLKDYTSLNGIEAIITSAYVMVLGSFVPIPGGSGGLEYGYLRLFANFQGTTFLTASMLIWRFVTYYLGMIVGSITLALYKKGDKTCE